MEKRKKERDKKSILAETRTVSFSLSLTPHTHNECDATVHVPVYTQHEQQTTHETVAYNTTH